jgi:hypothetical protein
MGLCSVVTYGTACAGDDGATGAAGFDDSGPDAGYGDVRCSPDLKPLAIGPEGTTFSDAAKTVSVRLDNIDPLQPNKSPNTWRIAVLDSAGQPATQATIGWSCAFMAIHRHATNPTAIKQVRPGVFELSDIYLGMYGPWQMKFWIDLTGATPPYLPQSGTSVGLGLECEPADAARSAASLTLDFCVPKER